VRPGLRAVVAALGHRIARAVYGKLTQQGDRALRVAQDLRVFRDAEPMQPAVGEGGARMAARAAGLAVEQAQALERRPR